MEYFLHGGGIYKIYCKILSDVANKFNSVEMPSI